MITSITSPPPALTQPDLAQLSATTPQTFVGIPPVLRWNGNAEIKIMPGYKVDGQDVEYEGGQGQVWVTEESLAFLTSSSSQLQGLSIPYPHITLHALSRTGQTMDSGDRPCIYCQVDSVAEGEEGEGEGDSWEVLIVPSETEQLDTVFQTLSSCASLHPPPSSLLSSSSSAPGLPGLDMDSLVYADADGNLVGGTDGRGNIAGWTAGEEEESAEGGRDSPPSPLRNGGGSVNGLPNGHTTLNGHR